MNELMNKLINELIKKMNEWINKVNSCYLLSVKEEGSKEERKNIPHVCHP